MEDDMFVDYFGHSTNVFHQDPEVSNREKPTGTDTISYSSGIAQDPVDSTKIEGGVIIRIPTTKLSPLMDILFKFQKNQIFEFGATGLRCQSVADTLTHCLFLQLTSGFFAEYELSVDTPKISICLDTSHVCDILSTFKSCPDVDVMATTYKLCISSKKSNASEFDAVGENIYPPTTTTAEINAIELGDQNHMFNLPEDEIYAVRFQLESDDLFKLVSALNRLKFSIVAFDFSCATRKLTISGRNGSSLLTYSQVYYLGRCDYKNSMPVDISCLLPLKTVLQFCSGYKLGATTFIGLDENRPIFFKYVLGQDPQMFGSCSTFAVWISPHTQDEY